MCFFMSWSGKREDELYVEIHCRTGWGTKPWLLSALLVMWTVWGGNLKVTVCYSLQQQLSWFLILRFCSLKRDDSLSVEGGVIPLGAESCRASLCGSVCCAHGSVPWRFIPDLTDSGEGWPSLDAHFLSTETHAARPWCRHKLRSNIQCCSSYRKLSVLKGFRKKNLNI